MDGRPGRHRQGPDGGVLVTYEGAVHEVAAAPGETVDGGGEIVGAGIAGAAR